MEEEQLAPEAGIIPPKRPRANERPPQPPRKSKTKVAGRYNEDDDDEGESSDDFEDFRPKSKRSKAAAQGSSAAEFIDTNQSLFESIKGSGKQIPPVVKRWVELYEKDPKHAMVELLSMLFEACGAKYKIQEDFLDETDVDDVVVALVNMARRGEVEDYQNSKKEFKNFKENLISVWDNLVVECQNGPLFDNNIFDKCIDYIIALSCTPPRVYRLVASLMGLQLVTSFISVAKMLGAQRETTRRQLDAEKKKGSDGSRVESLDKRYNVIHDKITILEEMMRKVFTGLFVHRYRDIDPDIRMSCIQSLGVWILSYPSLFLQDLYLKYLGWTLNDKSAGVRKASVLALQTIYEVDDNVPSLGLFTERFYKRMLELADDIDISVAVSAIGLVKQLLRHQLVPDEELGSLYDLLIDEPPEIRRAIGELVYDHLIAQKFNSSQPSSTGDDGDSSEVHLNRMMQILREFSADPILSSYVIDDVWDYMEAMKDWKRIITMLMADNPSAEHADEDATNLIRLLCASVKKAVGERIVPAIDNRKIYFTKAQRDMFDNNKRTVTLAMMNNYPLILRKYMSDKSKVPPLVEIILHMDLELYSHKRQEQSFKTVLQLMKEAFFKHGDKDALRSCVKTFNYCATYCPGELKDYALVILKETEEEILDKLKSILKDVEDDDDVYSVLVNLKRLYEFQLSKKVGLDSLYDDFARNLQSYRSIDDDVIIFLLLNMFMHIQWCLVSIVNSETVSETEISSLLSKRNTLFEQLGYFLTTFPQNQDDDTSRKPLASRVCTLLAELWFLFRKSKFESTKLKSLGYCPEDSTVQKFWEVCQQQLNISDETEEEDVNKEYIEETNRDAVMICAAKLVTENAVRKVYLGPEIISHFVMHGAGVSEIIKHLISAIKKNEEDISSILVEALKRAYQRYLISVSTGSSDATKSFEQCKDLGARLSATFVGAARKKHRSEILNIVSEGIRCAFTDAPKYLSFLDAIVHFCSRLPVPDVLDILKQVEKRAENVNTEADPSGWRPYFAFVHVLREKYAKNEGVQGDKDGNNVVRRRGRPRKKPNLQGKKLFDESDEEDSISGGSDQEEEEEAPLVHSVRSSAKLRSLRVPKDANTAAASASRTSGASS